MFGFGFFLWRSLIRIFWFFFVGFRDNKIVYVKELMKDMDVFWKVSDLFSKYVWYCFFELEIVL